MNSTDPSGAGAFTPPATEGLFKATTVRVAAASLFLLGVLASFHHAPGGLRWPLRVASAAALVWLLLVTVRAILGARFTARKFLFTLVLGGFFYLALWLMCHVFLRLMAARDDRAAVHDVTSLSDIHRKGITAMLEGASSEMYDRETGWQPRPGRWPDGTINSQGVRSLREYAIPPPDPEKRVLCLGDSFTIGDVVGDTETYPHHAEQLLPGTEWVNLGISGACMTQALMQYRKNGKRFGGKHVVIGFMTDDAKRSVNCFRPFLTDYNPFTKPFAKFSGGRFSLEPNPYQAVTDYQKLLSNEAAELARLHTLDYLTWSNQEAAHDPVWRTAQYVAEAIHLEENLDELLARERQPAPPKPKKISQPKYSVDPYGRVTWSEKDKRWTQKDRGVDPYGRALWNPGSPGFMAVARLFDLFHAEIMADGRTPLIVIIPGPFDVENHLRGYPRIYAAIADHFREKGYDCLDFLDTLVAHHKNDLSVESLYLAAHFRGHVNKELAEAIIQELHL